MKMNLNLQNLLILLLALTGASFNTILGPVSGTATDFLNPRRTSSRASSVSLLPTVRGGSSSSATSVVPAVSFAQRMWMGGVSRAIAQMVLYPIDALRTLAQTREGKTLADVGLGALVRGSTTTSMFALFMGSIQFSVFGACRDKVGPLIASALGAAGSCLVSVPQEVIKQRLVTGIYPSFRSAVSSIFREEGIRGFYSAWKPTMARNVPFVMTTFTTLDLFKSFCLRKAPDDKKELSTFQTIVIGMSAALVAGSITQPIDVIKTRMMTQAASDQAPYASALDCFLTILRTEGPGTLYAGFKQRSTYMCLLWGLTFALNSRFQKESGRPSK